MRIQNAAMSLVAVMLAAGRVQAGSLAVEGHVTVASNLTVRGNFTGGDEQCRHRRVEFRGWRARERGVGGL